MWFTLPSGTESSLHFFWDQNIRQILECLFPDGKSIRDSNSNTPMNIFCPDYDFLLNGLCTFRGEENIPENSRNPKVELQNKLIWAYSPAPYIFGYYATGTQLTLAAIGPLPSPDEKPVCGWHCKFSWKSRVQHICHLINLATLFKPVTDLVDIQDTELQEIKWSYCTIELSGPCVIKRYTCLDNNECINRLKSIYSQLVHKISRFPVSMSLRMFVEKAFS